MSLDGIVVSSIVSELNSALVDGKIDKVYQPEPDEILLVARNKGQNFKIVISASSNNPRVHFTTQTKSNPNSPPMFCMLLRKHLQGGKILKISQPSLERIIVFHIQSLDELGVLSTKELVVEIMGRHSNIILVEKDSQRILDSIKRVPLSVSSKRQVLPGLTYVLPPSQDKINPLDLSESIFYDSISIENPGLLVYKHIYSKYVGISPLIAREICYLSGIEDTTQIDSLDKSDTIRLYSSFMSIIQRIKTSNFAPTIVFMSNNEEVLAFSSIDLKQYGDYPKTHFDSISKVLEEFYIVRDSMDRIRQKSMDLRKSVSIKLDRTYNKLAKQKEELLDAEKREKYKIIGDLITANMYKLEKGLKEIEVNNYYSEDNELIKITLDPQLTPSQNAQKYYKKYNKLKNAFELVSEHIIKTKEEVDYLENILTAMDNCTEVSDLDEIKAELIREGYIKNNSKANKKNASLKMSKPRHYISSDGFDIYVGKNNSQNDYLTLKFSSKNDIWLHTKDIPGSHVIIIKKSETIPPSTIQEGAMIAAFYSKAKLSSNVPVDFTERKNVRKPNGAKPGMVIYDYYNTVYVTPAEDLINKIKQVED